MKKKKELLKNKNIDTNKWARSRARRLHKLSGCGYKFALLIAEAQVEDIEKAEFDYQMENMNRAQKQSKN